MQIVSQRKACLPEKKRNTHKKKKKKIINLSSAEIAKRVVNVHVMTKQN